MSCVFVVHDLCLASLRELHRFSLVRAVCLLREAKRVVCVFLFASPAFANLKPKLESLAALAGIKKASFTRQCCKHSKFAAHCVDEECNVQVS